MEFQRSFGYLSLFALCVQSAFAETSVPCKKDFDETLKAVTKVKELGTFSSSTKTPFALYEISINEDNNANVEYFLIERPKDEKNCRIVIRDTSVLSYRSGMHAEYMPKNLSQSVIEEAALIQARYEAGTAKDARSSYLKNLERLGTGDKNVAWLVSKLKSEWSLK